jgi:hypothetical protein
MSENRFQKYVTPQQPAEPSAAPVNRFQKYAQPTRPNVFDQFDPPRAQPRRNVFDQFDELPTSQRGEYVEHAWQPESATPVIKDGQLHNAPLAVQALGAITEGVTGLPGLPVSMMVGGGNFLRRQFDLPEVEVAPGAPAYDWGTGGWSDSVMSAANMPKLAAARNNTERLVQKAGLFFGGSAPFGPAGLVPTITSFAGSEAGRAADQVAPELTKGYGEAVGGVAGGVAGAYRRQPVRTPAPTRADIEASATKAFDDAESAGAIYSPQATGRLQNEVDTFLASKAFDDQMQPQVNRVRAKLDERVSNGVNVTLQDLHNLRKAAGNAAQSGNATERMMGAKLQQLIDDFLEGPMQPGDVVAGNSALAAAKLREGIKQWAVLKKLDRVDDALHNADVQASSTYSGGNIDNATRQKFRPMLTRGNKQSWGWTPDEKAMLRKVVKGGGVGQQFARAVGKLSPEAGFGKYVLTGLGAGSLANPAVTPMLGLSAAGFISKRIADAMTRSNVEDLLHTIQRGGTAYQPRTPQRMLTRASASAPGLTTDNDR